MHNHTNEALIPYALSLKLHALVKAEQVIEENWLLSLWLHMNFVRETWNCFSISKKKKKKDYIKYKITFYHFMTNNNNGHLLYFAFHQ